MRETGQDSASLGIDTWGVDFVLLDEKDQVLGDTVAYRDSRTEGMDEEVYKLISPEDLYARTGIQKQIFNTIYQLMAVKKQHPEYLAQAKAMLMIPDYFHFLLTGKKVQEYTEATTGQLINAKTNDLGLRADRSAGISEGDFPAHPDAGHRGGRPVAGDRRGGRIFLQGCAAGHP